MITTVKLPLWQGTKPSEATAVVSTEWAEGLNSLGKWFVNTGNGFVIGPPRHTRRCIDAETGKMVQVNILLNRTIFILLNYADPSTRSVEWFCTTNEGFQYLYQLHRTLTKVRVVDGDWHNCSDDNLDGSLTKRTEVRRVKENKTIALPEPTLTTEELETEDEMMKKYREKHGLPPLILKKPSILLESKQAVDPDDFPTMIFRIQAGELEADVIRDLNNKRQALKSNVQQGVSKPTPREEPL